MLTLHTCWPFIYMAKHTLLLPTLRTCALEEGLFGKGVLEKTSRKKSTNAIGQLYVIIMINEGLK
jgi:hypothetical protein